MKDKNRQNILDIINSFVEKNENYYHDSLDNIPIGSPIKIQTSKYNTPFYISIDQSIDKMLESITELQKKLNLKNSDLYLIVSPNMLKEEEITKKTMEFINKLKDNYSIVFEGNYIHDDINVNEENIFYWYNGMETNLNSVYQNAINDNLLCVPNESPVILIPNVYKDEPYKLKYLIDYMKSKFPENKLRFRLHILNKVDLLNLSIIMPIINEESFDVYLSDNLFVQEEKNNNSARSILRNKNELNMIMQNEVEKGNIKFHYLDSIYNSLKDIIDLEKNLDVLYSRIPSSVKDIDKITFVTLFMLNYFDIKDDKKLRTMFDFLKDRKGVCRDYAKFINTILNNLNIYCRCITGVYVKDNNDIEGHKFNVVTIDDKEYFLDVTWLALDLKSGAITSIEESENFLESNYYFYPSHKEYLKYDNTICDEYDREEIRKSIERVKSWKNNYYISINGIKDLLRKGKGENLKFSQDIIDSMPTKEYAGRR